MPINSKRKANEVAQKRKILDGCKTTEMAMDISAFAISLLVNTRMMFWKEMQKVVHRLRK